MSIHTLEKAMIVFWQKGYDDASKTDLVKAMGITPPSLYAAFGNKESLFLRTLRAKAEGDLPQAADPEALARYLDVVGQGLSIQAT